LGYSVAVEVLVVVVRHAGGNIVGSDGVLCCRVTTQLQAASVCSQL